jgi:hypothetical protein
MTGLTLDRATYQRLLAAWSGFGPEWSQVRKLCAERGFPFPPSGDPTDDRDDPEPSQRAIVWRSMDYRPAATIDAIRASRSWSEVVRKILALEDRMREDVQLAEKDAAWDKEHGPRFSWESLGAVMHRVKESLP